jgi:hypothetical protein
VNAQNSHASIIRIKEEKAFDDEVAAVQADAIAKGMVTLPTPRKTIKGKILEADLIRLYNKFR